jgi:heptaprenylglyceryl phosphate synthase
VLLVYVSQNIMLYNKVNTMTSKILTHIHERINLKVISEPLEKNELYKSVNMLKQCLIISYYNSKQTFKP